MIELNKIYCCDVMDGLKMLDDESIDLIITSPPYNKAGFNGIHLPSTNDKWIKTINYNDDIESDNMDESEYEDWQIRFLNECHRVLKITGSMFYNHKNRLKNNQISNPYEWITKSKFICRQEIIWDRGSSMNVDTCRYIPSTEKIFWLSKSNTGILFKRPTSLKQLNEVWRFDMERNNHHPAPFPIDIPDNIIPCIKKDEPIIVLDPFMGSGTVAVSAKKHGCYYIGFEKYEKYVEMSNERIKYESRNESLF